MKIDVKELVEINNLLNNSTNDAFKKGVDSEKQKPKPNNLFDSLLNFARKENVLIDYHKSRDDLDGCYWIQLKPTREDNKNNFYIEISFEGNQMEVSALSVTQLNK